MELNVKPFEYVRPASVKEAINAALNPGAMYMGAGTNLLDLMKGEVIRPSRLVDITHLPDLNNIEVLANGDTRIGALVRNGDLARNDAFAKNYPAVTEAILAGASGQLRNAATVGGNIMQRTRCSYFYDIASACNKRDPGAGCDARNGENRNAAIMGWSRSCIATHPSDFCVAMVALGAVAEVAGKAGTRDMPLTELHLLPGDTPHVENVLAPGELVVAIRLPRDAAAFAAHSRYLKVRERTSYAFALVSVAASLKIENARITEARIALGGVAAKPWRVSDAEALLVGAPIDEASFTEAAEAMFKDAEPSGDNAYKIALGKKAVIRCLSLAAAGTPDKLPALPASVFAAKPEGYIPTGDHDV